MVDAEPALDRDRHVHVARLREGSAHGRAARGDERGLKHEPRAVRDPRPAFPLRRATAVKVDLVVALGGAVHSGACKALRVGASELQHDRVLLGRKPDDRADGALPHVFLPLLALALTRVVVKDGSVPRHFRPEHRQRRDAPDEKAEVAVGHIDHRCDRE